MAYLKKQSITNRNYNWSIPASASPMAIGFNAFISVKPFNACEAACSLSLLLDYM